MLFQASMPSSHGWLASHTGTHVWHFVAHDCKWCFAAAISVSLLLLSSAGGTNTLLQGVQPQSTTEHAKHTAAVQAVAVSQLLSSLRNLTTIRQRSTDKLSNKPGQLAGPGATQVADAVSSAASLLDEGSPAISEPEMQQMLRAVSDGLEALQSQQGARGRTVPLSNTQQQELAAAASMPDPSAAPESRADPLPRPRTAAHSSILEITRQERSDNAAQQVPQGDVPGDLSSVQTESEAQTAALGISQAADQLEHQLVIHTMGELQQITDTLPVLLDSLQHAQGGSVTATPAYDRTEHKAPLSSSAEGPVGIASWEAASRLHQARSLPVQGQVPPEEPQGPVLVIHEAVVQELSVAVASPLDTLRDLQQKPHAQGGSSSMLTTPAEAVRAPVGSLPTHGSRVGSLRDVLNGQPANDKPPAGSTKSNRPASPGLPLPFSIRQQPGHQQQRPAADTQHQHNSPVKSTFLGALRDIGARRPAGIHPTNTAPLQQSTHGVRGNPAPSEESPITQPGPQLNPPDGVNSLLTDRSHLGPGIFGRPLNSDRDGVKSPSSSQVTQDDNAQRSCS